MQFVMWAVAMAVAWPLDCSYNSHRIPVNNNIVTMTISSTRAARAGLDPARPDTARAAMPADPGTPASWTPRLDRFAGPVYRAIADALAADIAAGRLGDGDRLPTHRDLAYRLSVTVGTVSRAYAEGARRGLTRGDVGRGTFVNARCTRTRPVRTAPGPTRQDPEPAPDRSDAAHPAPATIPATARAPADPFGPPVPGRLAPIQPPPGLPGTVAPGLIDFTVNHPVADGVADTLARLLRDVAAMPDLADMLGYQPSAGLSRHRAAAAGHVAATGVPAAAERMVLCTGVQNAIAIALTATTRPGDTVLVERLTYHGIKAIAATLGLVLRGVDLDGEGLRPESLAAAAAETGARVVVLVPTLQNPTGAVMSAGRRHEIIAVARRAGLLIVEDDIYGFLQPDAPPPLAALAPELVCYATGLSKAVAPALRAGMLHVPDRLVPRMAAAVRASTWMASPLLAEVAARCVTDGLAASFGARQRTEAAARQAIARAALAGFDRVSPASAFHLWLRLPPAWRAGEFIAVARARGVLLTPAEVFMADRSPAPEAVRLCLQASPDRRLVDRGLAILRDILTAPPATQLSIL